MNNVNQILLIHHGNKGLSISEALQGEFEHVTGLINSDTKLLTRQVIEKMNDDFFEVVVFDINFPQAPFGGLEIFTELAKNHRKHWDKTVFLTIYSAGNVRSSPELAAKIEDSVHLSDTERVYHFADMHAVDRDNILGPFASGTGYGSLKKKIRQLLI